MFNSIDNNNNINNNNNNNDNKLCICSIEYKCKRKMCDCTKLETYDHIIVENTKFIFCIAEIYNHKCYHNSKRFEPILYHLIETVNSPIIYKLFLENGTLMSLMNNNKYNRLYVYDFFKNCNNLLQYLKLNEPSNNYNNNNNDNKYNFHQIYKYVSDLIIINTHEEYDNKIIWKYLFDNYSKLIKYKSNSDVVKAVYNYKTNINLMEWIKPINNSEHIFIKQLLYLYSQYMSDKQTELLNNDISKGTGPYIINFFSNYNLSAKDICVILNKNNKYFDKIVDKLNINVGEQLLYDILDSTDKSLTKMQTITPKTLLLILRYKINITQNLVIKLFEYLQRNIQYLYPTAPNFDNYINVLFHYKYKLSEIDMCFLFENDMVISNVQSFIRHMDHDTLLNSIINSKKKVYLYSMPLSIRVVEQYCAIPYTLTLSKVKELFRAITNPSQQCLYNAIKYGQCMEIIRYVAETFNLVIDKYCFDIVNEIRYHNSHIHYYVANRYIKN